MIGLFGFEFGPVDPLALFVAACAFYLAWKESRRNNSVSLSIEQCFNDSIQTAHENDGKLFDRFVFMVKNRGVSLFGVTMAVSFRGRDGRGWLTIPMMSAESGETTEFARGMVGRFYLKSYLLDDDIGLLRMLRDPKNQWACLKVYSQNYTAYSFRIGGFWERVKTGWNAIAIRLNKFVRYSERIDKDGVRIATISGIVPLCDVIEWALMGFIEALKTKSELAGSPADATTAR